MTLLIITDHAEALQWGFELLLSAFRSGQKRAEDRTIDNASHIRTSRARLELRAKGHRLLSVLPPPPLVRLVGERGCGAWQVFTQIGEANSTHDESWKDSPVRVYRGVNECPRRMSVGVEMTVTSRTKNIPEIYMPSTIYHLRILRIPLQMAVRCSQLTAVLRTSSTAPLLGARHELTIAHTKEKGTTTWKTV